MSRARHRCLALLFAAPGRDAAGHHAWLAGVGGRVSQGDRAFDRSDRARRECRRRVSLRLSVVAGLWLLREAEDNRLGRRSYCIGLGGTDGSALVLGITGAKGRVGDWG